MTPVDTPVQQRQRNVRLALILASVALCFLGGFVIKITLLSQH